VLCSWSEERLAPFLDGELAAREQAALHMHLAQCRHCADLLAELRAIERMLLAPTSARLADDFTSRTMAGLTTLPPPPVRQRRSCARPLVAGVAAYLTAAWLLLAAGMLLAPHEMRGSEDRAVGTARVVAAAFGGVSRAVERLHP